MKLLRIWDKENTMKFNEYLNESKQEEMDAKKLFKKLYDKNKGDQKKIRKDILDNVVNTKYGHTSNAFVELMWDEFKGKFKS